LKAIHGSDGIDCPECHASLTGVALQRFWEGKRIRCCACGKFFTALTGTFLSGCHMSFSQFILLAVLLQFNVHHRAIATILRISTETVRLSERSIYEFIENSRVNPEDFFDPDRDKKELPSSSQTARSRWMTK